MSDDDFPGTFERMVATLEDYVKKLGKEIDVAKSTFRLATYHAYDPVHLTPQIVDMGGQKWALRFYVRTLLSNIPIVPGKGRGANDWAGDWTLDRTFRPAKDKVKTLHLTSYAALADAVKDSPAELRAMDFPYEGDLSVLSRSQREQLGKNLADIEPPQFIVDGAAFLRTLAHKATYDKDGNYWEKWQPGKENKEPWEANLTKEYFTTASEEITLQKGFYALQFSDRDVVVHGLSWPKTGVKRALVFSMLGNHGSAWGAPLKAVPQIVYLLYAADGLEKAWEPKIRSVYAKESHRSHSRVVDPQKLVEAVTGRTAAGDLGLKDEFDWFVELVKQYFPERFHVYDISYMERKGFLQLDGLQQTLRKAIKARLDEEGKKHRGVLTQRAQAKLKQFLDGNDKLVIIPQGYKTAEHARFIGFDNYYAYERHLDTGNVAIMPIEDYLYALAVGDLALAVYESTAWLIPFVTYMMYATFAIASLGVGVALEGGIAAVRSWVVQYAREKITKKALWELTKKLGPALIALLTEVVLNFFSDDPNDLAGRWLAFARGFFRGYVYDTIYDHLVNHVFFDTITKGPREVRMVLAAKKVFATVDKMLDMVHTLEQELDDNAIQDGLNHFKGAAGKLAEGAALLFSAIYYLPHDQAEPLLKMFGQNAAGEPPDPKLWAAEAKRQLGHVTATLGELAHLKSVEDVLQELKSSRALKGLMVVAVLEPQIIWTVEYTWHKHMPKGTGWPTFLFVALAGILYLDHVTDDKFAIVLSDLIVDLLRHFPGATAERAELVGKLIGDFYGGMVMNNTVWSEGDLEHGGTKKPSLLAKWRMAKPLSGSTVWGNVKWGPIDSILELLLNRYLFLYEKLKTVPGEVGKARDFIADSVQSMSDKKLDEEGWGHLKDFHDDSHKGLSMKQIGLAIVKLRRQLAIDLESFLEHHHKDIEEYQSDIVAFNRLVEKGGLDFHVPANEKEAKYLYHQMLRHLYLALDSLAEALRLLFQPFTKSGFSWIRLLQELGLDVGDISKLQDEVMKKAKDELQHFKKS